MNYEMIDRFLWENLGDDDYAEYSAALNSLCTPPQRKTLTDEMVVTNEMVVTAARMLNERQAIFCGVDRDDQWAIYCDDFKADARAMLAAAHGIKE